MNFFPYTFGLQTPPPPVNLLLCPSVGGGQQVQSCSQQASGHQAQRQPSFHSRCGTMRGAEPLYSAVLTTSSHRHHCHRATTQLFSTKQMLIIRSKMHYSVIFFLRFNQNDCLTVIFPPCISKSGLYIHACPDL